jgi:two-component system cell cycle response regulator DivK
MTSTSILVIEDHPVNSELLSSLLEVNGYSVMQATTASEGIELARAVSPCLILMDMSLPGMCGLDATRLLVADPRTAAIPVVAVTAHAFEKDRLAALAAGCSAFISKPINTRTLMSEIKRVLGTTTRKGSTLS